MWITYPLTHTLLKASDQNDHSGQKSSVETHVEEQQSCSDWLFDRTNLDPKIQVKFVDTKKQLADTPTKESFTRDEWDHLLHLLRITNFSMFSCSDFLSIRKQSVMSKGGQESTPKEGSTVTKPTPMNLVSRNLLSAKKDPPQDLSDPNSLGNQELD